MTAKATIANIPGARTSEELKRLPLIPGTNENYRGDDDDDYNPAEREFDGDYTPINESGIATIFDATTGQVLTESDRHNPPVPSR